LGCGVPGQATSTDRAFPGTGPMPMGGDRSLLFGLWGRISGAAEDVRGTIMNAAIGGKQARAG